MKLNITEKQEHLNLMKKHYYFDIELSANCNLSCVFCPRNHIERNETEMSKEMINVLSKWLPQNASIMFSGMGEPLLNDNLFELINKLSNKKRIIGITTNGQLLNDNVINKLENSKLNFLQISVNETDNLKYQQISGGKSNENIKTALNKLYKKGIHNKIELQFSFVTNGLDKNEIKKQQDFSKKFNAIFFQKQIHNRGGYLNKNANENYNSCYIFSQITYINSDGNILYCCHDLKAKSIIGNIKTHSFNEILELKKNVITNNNWLPQCEFCDDKGRKILIK